MDGQGRAIAYSPRMWRWSYIFVVNYLFFTVFSTYVEMILPNHFRNFMFCRILHVCGDDPIGRCITRNGLRYSPRMWRWSYAVTMRTISKGVFSTYVEMILFLCIVNCLVCSILHVCGDDPNPATIIGKAIQYSPRMWRWSLTSQELRTVDECILHVCGDDPMGEIIQK